LGFLDSCGEGFDGAVRAFTAGAGFGVESPAVEGAADMSLFQGSGTERAATVRAGVFDGVEVTVDVVDGELLSVDVDGSAFSGREAFGVEDGDEIEAVLSGWGGAGWD